MTTLTTIRTSHGPRSAPIHAADGGLGIAEFDRDYFLVHLRSGLTMYPPLVRRAPRDLITAHRVLAVALAAGIDWTQDVETIKAVVSEPQRRALYNRMRLAAEPPRRSRWHHGLQRRRRKPYEAQSKREALREASATGSDILRSMWRDLWPYHRRSEAWGVIPAVIRQPCKRFGVTRELRKVEL